MPDNRVDERDEAERDSNTLVNEVEEKTRPKTTKEREAEKQRRLAELEEEKRKKREEELYQKELERRRHKRKLITPAVVLVVCAIASITMFLMRFDTTRMLKWELCILLVSWIVGSLIQFMFEYFARQNEKAELSDEGEVINKGTINPDEIEDETHG